MPKNIKRDLAAIVSTVAITIGSLFLPGCDNHGGADINIFKPQNRADISKDGTKIAFSLNKEAGFEVDETSEMYTIGLNGSSSDPVDIKRITIDDKYDSWASLSPDGEILLYVKGSLNSDGMGIYVGAESIEAPLRISEYLSPWYNFPLMQSNEENNFKIFYAYLSPTNLNEKKPEIVCQLLSQLPEGNAREGELKLEELVRIPWGEKEKLWSIPPAFSGEKMYYATGKILEDVIVSEEVDKKKSERHDYLLNITIHSVDLNTKIKRDIADLVFKEPVGMADLAVSPDNKGLICCFLSQEEEDMDNFNDNEPSLVYGIDLEDGEVEELGKIHMYNPHFVPIFETENPETQPSNLEKKVEEYNPEIIYLSGRGYESKGRSVMIASVFDLEKTEKELARLPDETMQAYTGWAWLSENRLRIYQIGESGLIIIDINKDGTNQLGKYLDREHLALLKKAADLETSLELFKKQYQYVLDQFNLIPEQPQEITKPAGYVLISFLEKQVEGAKAAANEITFIEGYFPASVPASQPFTPLEESIQLQPAIPPNKKQELD